MIQADDMKLCTNEAGTISLLSNKRKDINRDARSIDGIGAWSYDQSGAPSFPIGEQSHHDQFPPRS